MEPHLCPLRLLQRVVLPVSGALVAAQIAGGLTVAGCLPELTAEWAECGVFAQARCSAGAAIRDAAPCGARAYCIIKQDLAAPHRCTARQASIRREINQDHALAGQPCAMNGFDSRTAFALTSYFALFRDDTTCWGGASAPTAPEKSTQILGSKCCSELQRISERRASVGASPNPQGI